MSTYYSGDKLMSYNAILSITIGGRSIGKTYWGKEFCLKRYLKYGEQFVFCRRYKEDVKKACESFWNDIVYENESDKYDDHTFDVQGDKLLVDGEVAGYYYPLSTASKLKSSSYPKVKTVVYDEFMLEQSATSRYLPNEGNMILDIANTLFRRRKARILCIGNSISVHNPILSFFNLRVDPKKEYVTRDLYNPEIDKLRKNGITLEYVKSDIYKKEMQSTDMGMLAIGTDYERYSINNEFLEDNNDFIRKRPKTSRLWFNFTIEGKTLSVWEEVTGNGNVESGFYISDKSIEESRVNFVFSDKDHRENKRLLTNLKQEKVFKDIKKGYENGYLFFTSQNAKKLAQGMLNKL